MSEWKEYRLGDICQTNKSQYSAKENWPHFLYLDTGNITKGNIDSIQEFNSFEKLPSRARRKVVDGDIIYSSVRPNQEHYGYIKNPPINLLVSTGFVVITANKEIINPIFLYNYLTRSEITKYLQAIAEQSVCTYPAIKPGDIENLVVKIPSLEIQEKIASILSAFENKIAINRRICENLEAQAQALFKHWFIDFAPFKDGKFFESELGMIPEGWRVVSLSDIMDYAGGSQPPASEFIREHKEGYVRFVQIRDYETNSHITYIPVSKKNKLCSEKDIMIARYGVSLGRICMGLNGAYNVALAKVFPKKEYYREYLRCYLKTNYFYQKINSVGGRAAQAGFNQSDINSFMVAFPSDDRIVLKFEEMITTFIEEMLKVKKESNTLMQLRDTLLPKLMSGQIKL